YDPAYYKWTQWIFVQMFKHGLAYRKKAKVNWCPSCKTVLADEQVINGNCERCGTAVIKKDLEQWFFKTTDYAERLLNNLEKIDWSEKIKIAQRNWIGKSEGTEISFEIKNKNLSIKVFTTRVDTLWGATFLVLAPEHPIIWELKNQVSNSKEIENYVQNAIKKSELERAAEGREKTGIEVRGAKAVNPLNNQELPIWIADYALINFGTGALFGDAHDERDVAFAKRYHIPLKPTIKPADEEKIEGVFIEDGVLYDSGQFSGMTSSGARVAITKWLSEKGKGRKVTTYRIRDWLISRQRYWGPPIPLVFCENCAGKIKNQKSKIKIKEGFNKGELENPGWMAVPEKDLPVKLPFIKNFRPTGTGQSPLASVKSFYETKCPKCGAKARRETDVSDTFLDSAWYFLRYPSVKMQNSKIKIQNENAKSSNLGIRNSELEIPWNQEITRRWLPVQMYIGGAEHSVLHLLYSRFLTMVFKDWELLDFEEPFTIFRAHGLIIKDGAKMSKSKGNIVNPDDYIKAYGADALRLYLMFTGPFQEGGDFRDSGIAGMTRFLNRVWRFYSEKSKIKSQKSKLQLKNQKLERIVHRTIKKITEDIVGLRYNTAISALMILLNEFEEFPGAVSGEDVKIFLQLLAPFAPHIAEELWSRFFADKKSRIRDSRSESGQQRDKGSIHKSSWPSYDEKLIHEDTFQLIVQVNGKVRGRINLPRGVSQKDAESAVRADAAAAKFLTSEPQKVVFVRDRLINFVV
ncbi:MAG: leucine--tRNA ligase, partial [Candidatus Sungbacteria bacterium]|nr:leucine--tRNA ligase [Candidatus Sungbacteria bacterium]